MYDHSFGIITWKLLQLLSLGIIITGKVIGKEMHCLGLSCLLCFCARTSVSRVVCWSSSFYPLSVEAVLGEDILILYLNKAETLIFLCEVVQEVLEQHRQA